MLNKHTCWVRWSGVHMLFAYYSLSNTKPSALNMTLLLCLKNAETVRVQLTVWVTPGCGSSARGPNSLLLQWHHESPENAVAEPSGHPLLRTSKTKRTFWIHRSPNGSASRTRPRRRGRVASETFRIHALIRARPSILILWITFGTTPKMIC